MEGLREGLDDRLKWTIFVWDFGFILFLLRFVLILGWDLVWGPCAGFGVSDSP